MSEKERIELLHKKYLSLRENTPWEKRDGEECKAYHEWYDSAYVYFKSLEHLQNDPDFKIFVSAEKEGNCFVLEHIYDSISPSYKVLLQQTEKKRKIDNVETKAKTPMVFISHSSKDIAFVEALVDLLEFLGLNKHTMFCSSVPGYGIKLSGRIIDNLLSIFDEHNLYVIFVQSPNYYNSPISLNEMGAAWVLRSGFCSFLTADMDFDKMKGVIDSSYISIKVNASDAVSRLNQMKDEIVSMFDLSQPDASRWETKRNNFLRLVENHHSEIAKGIDNSVEKEYQRLQIEKLKQEAIEKQQAKIRGNIIESRTRGNRILKIFNAGQSVAKQVTIEWLNPDGLVMVQWEFGLIGDISPQSGRQYHIALCEGHPETMRLRYTWADDYSDNNVFEEDVQL